MAAEATLAAEKPSCRALHGVPRAFRATRGNKPREAARRASEDVPVAATVTRCHGKQNKETSFAARFEVAHPPSFKASAKCSHGYDPSQDPAIDSLPSIPASLLFDRGRSFARGTSFLVHHFCFSRGAPQRQSSSRRHLFFVQCCFNLLQGLVVVARDSAQYTMRMIDTTPGRELEHHHRHFSPT